VARTSGTLGILLPVVVEMFRSTLFRSTLRLAVLAALFASPSFAVFAQDKSAPTGPAAPPPTVPSNPAAAAPAPATPAPAMPNQPTTPRAGTPSITPPSVSTPAGSPSTTTGTPSSPSGSSGSGGPPSPGTASPGSADAATNRLTGLETNRTMIAAEEPTTIVVNGSGVANCGIAIEFGDGTRSSHIVSDASPFPVRTPHTYAKMGDFSLRVSGAANGATPPCDGVLDARIHVSPAGSKVEMITLSVNSCPIGWSLVGEVNSDKSFRCTPVQDASAPTNLIHCTEGMKYFAKGGYIGCMHPAAAIAEAEPPAAKPAMKGRAHGRGMAMHKGMGGKGMMTGASGESSGSNAKAVSSAAGQPSATAAPKPAAGKKKPIRKAPSADKAADTKQN
jgi:hypothetical protein